MQACKLDVRHTRSRLVCAFCLCHGQLDSGRTAEVSKYCNPYPCANCCPRIRALPNTLSSKSVLFATSAPVRAPSAAQNNEPRRRCSSGNSDSSCTYHGCARDRNVCESHPPKSRSSRTTAPCSRQTPHRSHLRPRTARTDRRSRRHRRRVMVIRTVRGAHQFQRRLAAVQVAGNIENAELYPHVRVRNIHHVHSERRVGRLHRPTCISASACTIRGGTKHTHH